MTNRSCYRDVATLEVTPRRYKPLPLSRIKDAITRRRRTFSAFRRTAFAVLTILAGNWIATGPSFAATGDLRFSFVLPEPFNGDGTALAFDGAGTLYWTELVASTTYKTTTSGTLLGEVGGIWGALCWDPTGPRLWATSWYGGAEVYKKDPVTGDSSFAFNSAAFGGFNADSSTGRENLIIGLAFDASDNTLWLNGDLTRTLYHVTTSGGLIATFAAPNHPITGNPAYLMSTVVDPSGRLWLGLAEAGAQGWGSPPYVIASVTKVNPSVVTAFFEVTAQYNPVGMAFDSVTFAPKCALWVRRNDGLFSAYEIPANIPPTSRITYDIQAYIDGADILVIQGGTLQWQHQSFAAVGRHEGANQPTVISAWRDGVKVMDSVNWIPEWPEPPPAEIRYPALSSVFTGLAPELPNGPMTVTLTRPRARGNLDIAQYPEFGNSYQMELAFDDDSPLGADWYEAQITVTTAAVPVISCSPTSLSFADQTVPVGSSATKPITISNFGNKDLRIALISTSGPDAGEFSADQTGPFTVAPAGSQTVNITFTPQTLGKKSASLNITHDAQDPNPVAVPLEGGMSDRVPAPAHLTFSNPNAIQIPDRGPADPYPSTIEVDKLDGVVQSVTVQLNNLTHSFPRDLGFLLVGPAGQKALLMSAVGAGMQLNDVTLLFDGSVGAELPEPGPILSGRYRPTAFNQNYPFELPVGPGPYASDLDTFRDRSPNGTWSLYAYDNAAQDQGVVATGWSLTIDTEPYTAGTIDPIPDQFAAPNTAAGPIAIMVHDRVRADQWTISGHSSNPTLIPDANLQFGSANGWTSLMLIPAADQTGMATITVTVNDGVGEFNTSFQLTVAPTDHESQTFYSPSAIQIPDQGAASPYPSTISVADLTGAVNTITVTLNQLVHGWVNDVAVLLVSPGGQTALLTDIGWSGRVTFDDAAAAPLVRGHFVPGTYRPTKDKFGVLFPPPAPPGPYAAALSVFKGVPPNGSWSLYVVDDAAGDSGSIAGGWDLTVTTAAAAPPSISPIADQSTVMNAVSAPAPFTVGDALTPANDLIVSGTSSNPTLIPDGNILLGGNGSNRTVNLLPARGQSGSATITISVTNRTQLGVSTSFEVSVSSEPGAMTFANPELLIINREGPATPYPSAIQVSGMSGVVRKATAQLYNYSHSWPSDVSATLVSPTGQSMLLMADVGANHRINNVALNFDDAALTKLVAGVTAGPIATGTYRPTWASFSTFNGRSPNGQWSLYVFDDGEANGGSIGAWSLTIYTTEAAPPTISAISDQSMPLNTVSPSIPFVVGDALTPAGDLVVSGSSSNPTLIPDEAILCGGDGPNRTVTLRPASGQTGSATITISVTNRTQLGVSTSFGLTVNPDGSVMTFANPAAITIPGQGAATPYPSTIQVSGLPGTVSKVTATLYNFTHTWPHDVGVLLVSPSGEATLLLADAGGGHPARNVTLGFEDGAPGSLTQQLIEPGTYRPTSFDARDPFPPGAPAGPYPASLSVFNGITPNGTWSLYVADDAADDSGTIANGWSVTLYTTGDSAGLLSTRFSPRASGTEGRTWAAPASASPASAWIESMTVWPDGQVHLIVGSEPGRGYTVQASSNATDWHDLFTSARPSAPFDFIDPHGREHPQRFYRLKVLEMSPALTR